MPLHPDNQPINKKLNLLDFENKKSAIEDLKLVPTQSWAKMIPTKNGIYRDQVQMRQKIYFSIVKYSNIKMEETFLQ